MTLNDMEAYAKENNIPIMLEDGIDYLCKLIKEENIKSILEIGSAIGYSAIKMALVDNEIKITTIEKDEGRYKQALSNIKSFDLEKRINLINIDALEYETDKIFDLIFIDASKSHNIDFFNKYSSNLKKYGTIVTDNLSFHGLVDNEELIKTKNQKGIVRKIKMFLTFLHNNLEFSTTYIEVGDRLAVSRKR